jgi:hypothetical protein
MHERVDLLQQLSPMPSGLPLLMDRAYEGDEITSWRSISVYLRETRLSLPQLSRIRSHC